MALQPRPPRRWVLLRDRHGGHALDPTAPRRLEALRELFEPSSEAAEPGECSLETGTDGGPVFHLVFTGGRQVRFEEWSPPTRKADAVLVRLREADGLTDAEAEELWAWLAAGDLDALRAWRWSPA